MMDLVVIGQGVKAHESIELRYAERQLLACLPKNVVIIRCEATSADLILGAALEAVDQLGLQDSSRVLLLGHPYLWPAQDTLQKLDQALHRGASAAFAYDSTQTFPELAPDYMTVRGIERYVTRLGSFADQPVQPDSELPLCCLLTAGAARQVNWTTRAVRVPGAYVHDFSGYHQGRREEVLPLVPSTVRRVLDVGGGEGGFLTMLKVQRGCETHLAEFSEAACAAAAHQVDKVWVGDFMSAPFDTKFDCISFLDVLEHTPWPVQWLGRAADLLHPDGCVVVSIPNVGHWSVVLDLLEGRWDYAPAGIHCVTHLRFFTRHGVVQLMAEAGMRIEEIVPTVIEPPAWFEVSTMGGQISIDHESLSSYGFLVRARPLT
jgi:2-polyprenyl-3-methyl-5-hydroxy-6-metoxy-1,4-benzoquinol methylase